MNKAISYWTEWANKPNVQRYDIALFKIWIQFELFIGELFFTYSTGGTSEEGYSPELKLRFQDEEQFTAFMTIGNKTYVDYLKMMETLSRHIFNNNPFDVILATTLKSRYDQMKAIRNYIAHESVKAKREMINTCFNGDKDRFVEPNVFLKSRESSTKDTYYTYYINTIRYILEFLINPK